MDYYEIQEEFMNIHILSEMMSQLREIMDRYPNTRSMTLEEAWRFMNNRLADRKSSLHKVLKIE